MRYNIQCSSILERSHLTSIMTTAPGNSTSSNGHLLLAFKLYEFIWRMFVKSAATINCLVTKIYLCSTEERNSPVWNNLRTSNWPFHLCVNCPFKSQMGCIHCLPCVHRVIWVTGSSSGCPAWSSCVRTWRQPQKARSNRKSWMLSNTPGI